MARSKKTPNPYDAYRTTAYANVANRNGGRIDDLDDVVDEVLALTPAVAVGLANRAAARLAIEAEDDHRTNPPHWEIQQTLPGWPDPSDTFWKVGEGQRVRVDAASAADHVKHVRIIEENERSIVDSARVVRHHYYELEPYYRAGAASVSDAVARWQQDHP